MRRPRHRLPARAAFTVAVAVSATIASVIVLAVVTPSGPRSVRVAEAAAIDPLNTTVGFADADVYGMSQADVEKTTDQWVATGRKTVRIMIPWMGVEPLQGHYNWGNVDRLVNAALAKDVSIMGFINSTPGWAASGGTPVSGRPKDPALYGDFCAKVAQRYKGKISVYEIWNEPNGIIFYSPKPDPAGYTDLLKAAYPKIKAVDPSATVIGAVLAAVLDFGNVTMNPVRFVEGMYAAGAKGSFDALSFHPYHYKLKFSDGVMTSNSPVDQLIRMRQLMVNNGDSSKKIWGTEYGVPISRVTEVAQADFVRDILTKWQELPYTGPMLIYTTRDRRTGSTNDQDTFGVYRTDWTARPAQRVIASPPGKSAEYGRFAEQTNPAWGDVLSPVFRATPTVWAQKRSVRTLWEIGTTFVTAPNPVADIALPKKATPTNQFSNGVQDFTSPGGSFKIWYSDATGAHFATPAISKAWVPQLGLATTDPYSSNGGNQVDFERGYIIWKPWTGSQVVVT